MDRQHVCVLMATRNGAAYLATQLESIASQDHVDWSLWVSDDRSGDTTRDILGRFCAEHPGRDIRLYDGPGRGSAANFMSLLASRDLPQGAYLALCDQDDVWMPHRLTRALDRMEAGNGRHAQIYASRTVLTDARLRPLRISRRHPHSPAFGNALVQNILSGNTVVLNPVAADLVRHTSDAALAGDGVPHHDWWLYQLMTGAGAEVVYDEKPGIYYRQHETNLLGANRGARQALSRFSMIRDRRYAAWIDRNLAALEQVSGVLTAVNRDVLARFRDWRRGASGQPLGKWPNSAGVWRQTAIGNLLLWHLARTGQI